MILLSFGHGYSASALERRLLPQGWEIIATTRDPKKAEALRARGLSARVWGRDDLSGDIGRATHILSSVAPEGGRDPVLGAWGGALAPCLDEKAWIGYLSTTGVYGDHGGAWVDETSPLTPNTDRGRARVAAESEWAAVCRQTKAPLHIFRLAGIYGPHRGPFEKLRNGTARRIVKEGQVFSRIHVEDIAMALEASMKAQKRGAVYNICDDIPAPPEDVIAYGAELLGLPIPPAIAFEHADLGPMAASFYSENKRVKNDHVKADLGLSWLYPDYKSGLKAILAAGG